MTLAIKKKYIYVHSPFLFPHQVAAVGAKVGTKLKGLTPSDVAGFTSLSQQLQDTLVPTHHVLMQLHVSTLNSFVSKDLRGESSWKRTRD